MKTFIEDAAQRARALLTKHRAQLEVMASQLLERESLTATELEPIRIQLGSTGTAAGPVATAAAA